MSALMIIHHCPEKGKISMPRFIPLSPQLPPGFKAINQYSAELVECPFCGSAIKKYEIKDVETVEGKDLQ